MVFQFTNSAICEGPNTVLAFNNECVCVDGFPFGDPNSKEGCYKCDQKCHSFAKCQYPGNCVCDKPYHGDGILTCELDIPHLISFSPKNGTVNGGTDVEINYKYSNSFSEEIPKVAYCRFGSLVVRSESVSDETVLCKTPPHCPKPAFLSISFDTISWSKEDVFFGFFELNESQETFENNDNNDRNKNIGLVSVGIIVLILLCALLVILIKRFKLEKLPFALRKKAIFD